MRKFSKKNGINTKGVFPVINMRSLVSEYHSGDQTVKEFCFGKRVAVTKMLYWIRKCRTESKMNVCTPTGKFSPVKIIPSVVSPSSACSLQAERSRIEIQYRDGTRLFIDGSCDVERIKELLPAVYSS